MPAFLLQLIPFIMAHYGGQAGASIIGRLLAGKTAQAGAGAMAGGLGKVLGQPAVAAAGQAVRGAMPQAVANRMPENLAGVISRMGGLGRGAAMGTAGVAGGTAGLVAGNHFFGSDDVDKQARLDEMVAMQNRPQPQEQSGMREQDIMQVLAQMGIDPAMLMGGMNGGGF
jgi:hypothetical protein